MDFRLKSAIHCPEIYSRGCSELVIDLYQWTLVKMTTINRRNINYLKPEICAVLTGIYILSKLESIYKMPGKKLNF
jgi:hypothetical protein